MYSAPLQAFSLPYFQPQHPGLSKKTICQLARWILKSLKIDPTFVVSSVYSQPFETDEELIHSKRSVVQSYPFSHFSGEGFKQI